VREFKWTVPFCCSRALEKWNFSHINTAAGELRFHNQPHDPNFVLRPYLGFYFSHHIFTFRIAHFLFAPLHLHVADVSFPWNLNCSSCRVRKLLGLGNVHVEESTTCQLIVGQRIRSLRKCDGPQNNPACKEDINTNGVPTGNLP
jgi:hypothetical protein